jgi:hypothetical protein
MSSSVGVCVCVCVGVCVCVLLLHTIMNYQVPTFIIFINYATFTNRVEDEIIVYVMFVTYICNIFSLSTAGPNRHCYILHTSLLPKWRRLRPRHWMDQCECGTQTLAMLCVNS